MTDWSSLAQRASRASHDLIGWIFWDPRAVANYAALGVPDGLGYYFASRLGPVAAAGNDLAAATCYSVHPGVIAMALDLCREHTDSESAMTARDDAVLPGLREVDESIPERLAPLADPLWSVVDGLHNGGRALFAAHRERPRPADAALSAWLAVNCLREWRGDTHWGICLAADLDAAEVGLLHEVMVDGYAAEWIARSRGADDDAIERAWDRLEAKGFARDRAFTEAGRAFRADLEQRTDEICGRMWETLGARETVELCEIAEPHHEVFLARIDATAGPNWMPAARHRA